MNERGQLLIIGGAEGRDHHDSAILARFVELAGGPQAHIVVIATASGQPDLVEADYVDAFKRLGTGAVVPLRLETREQANSADAVAALGLATGVFFTGGDQVRITNVIGGTRTDSILHTRLDQRELVLAGTSAGAAMMSSTMVVGGREAGVTTSSVLTGPGLEFLPGVLIDMHFAERGRLNRLLSAIALYPHELGVGIDEDTAILVDHGRFEVIGSGSVTIADAGPAAMINTPVDRDGPIALCGVQLHVLPTGYAFRLNDRMPCVVEAPAT